MQNLNGTETCDGEDCLNSYTPHHRDGRYLCLTCK